MCALVIKYFTFMCLLFDDSSRGHAKSIHLPVPYVRLDGPYPNELSEYATVDLPNVDVLENEEQPTFVTCMPESVFVFFPMLLDPSRSLSPMCIPL